MVELPTPTEVALTTTLAPTANEPSVETPVEVILAYWVVLPT